MERELDRVQVLGHEPRFNSLQTGRYGESRTIRSRSHLKRRFVSIPFKREGTGKAVLEAQPLWKSVQCFHSLQTGRYGERSPVSYLKTNLILVSIPFKREGTWKVSWCRRDFLFSVYQVSIPFKREGTWKAVPEAKSSSGSLEFQFPSNGKGRGKVLLSVRALDKDTATRFQFPSNGKGRGKP